MYSISPVPPPAPEELSDHELYLAYVCPLCGHPTVEHSVDGGHSIRLYMRCSHQERMRLPEITMDFTGRYHEILGDKTELVDCQCNFHDLTEEFAAICERNKQYWEESKWRQILRQCKMEI